MSNSLNYLQKKPCEFRAETPCKVIFRILQEPVYFIQLIILIINNLLFFTWSFLVQNHFRLSPGETDKPTSRIFSIPWGQQALLHLFFPLSISSSFFILIRTLSHNEYNLYKDDKIKINWRKLNISIIKNNCQSSYQPARTCSLKVIYQTRRLSNTSIIKKMLKNLIV